MGANLPLLSISFLAVSACGGSHASAEEPVAADPVEATPVSSAAARAQPSVEAHRFGLLTKPESESKEAVEDIWKLLADIDPREVPDAADETAIAQWLSARSTRIRMISKIARPLLKGSGDERVYASVAIAGPLELTARQLQELPPPSSLDPEQVAQWKELLAEQALPMWQTARRAYRACGKSEDVSPAYQELRDECQSRAEAITPSP